MRYKDNFSRLGDLANGICADLLSFGLKDFKSLQHNTRGRGLKRGVSEGCNLLANVSL
jgi:hypothetical protein